VQPLTDPQYMHHDKLWYTAQAWTQVQMFILKQAACLLCNLCAAAASNTSAAAPTGDLADRGPEYVYKAAGVAEQANNRVEPGNSMLLAYNLHF
jgi:hypothetical protein